MAARRRWPHSSPRWRSPPFLASLRVFSGQNESALASERTHNTCLSPPKMKNFRNGNPHAVRTRGDPGNPWAVGFHLPPSALVSPQNPYNSRAAFRRNADLGSPKRLPHCPEYGITQIYVYCEGTGECSVSRPRRLLRLRSRRLRLSEECPWVVEHWKVVLCRFGFEPI